MLNGKREAMKIEALEAIKDCLSNGYSGYYCDLHNEVFNTNYYIIGGQAAIEALEEYGTWGAIDEVQTYEDDNFGERFTDLSEPEKVINMIYYIIGEEVIGELDTISDVWNDEATDDNNKMIIAEINKLLEEEE